MIRRALISSVVALGLCAVACSKKPAPSDQKATARAEPAAPVAANEIARPSLYDLKLTLTDQDGQALALDAFAGKPVVISMFYAKCSYACPTLISDVKRVVAALDPKVRAETRVLLVSFDPKHDTPAALKTLAQTHKVDTQNWRFVSAPEPQVRELAAVLGIKYRMLENGHVNHSSVVTVLDRRGVPRHKNENLGQFDPTLVRELSAIASTRLDG